MVMGTEYKLRRDSRKFVVVPATGNRYFFEGERSYAPKDKLDADYFESNTDSFESVEVQEVVNRTEEDSVMSTTVKEGSTPASPSTPSNPDQSKTDENADLKALERDDSIEDKLFAENPDGPWDCPICGKKGLTSKSGVRSHIGSKTCTKAARKNDENNG